MGKRHLPPLEARRIRLRLLEESDLPQTLAWRNQDGIRRWFFFSERLAAEQHAEWFARYQQRDDDFVFVIEETTGENISLVSEPGANCFRPIGQVAIYNIDWSGRTGEFGRLMIGEADSAGRGLAREATVAALDLAFRQLGLREVHLEVLPGNVRAIHVYEACGFEIAGRTERSVRMSKRVVATEKEFST